MSALAMSALAVFVLALGVALFGISVLQRYRRSDREAQTVDRALLRQPPGHADAVADGGGPRTPWQRLLDSMEFIGRSFEGASWSKALLAPEDRLLLDQTHCNTAAGRATFLGTRLALALLLPSGSLDRIDRVLLLPFCESFPTASLPLVRLSN